MLGGQPVVSWRWQADKPGVSRFIDEQEWTGTRGMAAYLSGPEAIRFAEEQHGEAARGACCELARHARTQITALKGLAPLSPDSPDGYRQMVRVPLPPCGSEELKRPLWEEFRVEAPIRLWNGTTLLRASVQAYNTRADIDALVGALRLVLRKVT